MEKKVILLSAVMLSSLAFSQVGINNTSPASTLDVTAKTSGTTSTVEGLLVPRVDRQRAQSMTGIPVSTLIYVINATTGTQAGYAANIDAPGYYYFDESNVWTKLKAPAGTPAADSNIYDNNGTIQSNRTVAQADKTLAITSTATTGTNHFSVDGSTLSVDAVNNRVGIGTTAPATKLDINNGTTAGAIKIVDGTQGANKVLMSDANGVGAWRNLAERWVGFLSGGSGSAVTVAGKINFTNAQVFGQGGGSASSATDTVTVPVTGVYEIIVSGLTTPPNTTSLYDVTWSIRVNGGDIAGGIQRHTYPKGNGVEVSATFSNISLSANDVISLFLDFETDSTGTPISANQASRVDFAVKLIQ